MNKERYSDPTAEKAIAHIMREYRKEKKQENHNISRRGQRTKSREHIK